MIKFAPVLLDHCPDDTTQFLIDFYTGQYKPKKDEVVVEEKSKQVTEGGFGPGITISAVQGLFSIIPLPYMNLGGAGPGAQASDPIELTEAPLADPPIQYDIPPPRAVFSAFLNRPFHFAAFLKACASGGSIEGRDKQDVYTALLEMYLHLSKKKRDGKGELEEKTEFEKKAESVEGADWEAKARELINNPDIPIPKSSILLLSDLENFPDGTTLVREQEGLRLDIFRSYTAAKDTPGVIRALKKYGRDEPELYPLALKYFTSSPAILAESEAEIGPVLDRIDATGLMAPLQVIQMLTTGSGASGDVATIGLIKPYLTRVIDRQQAEIAKHRAEAEKNRHDAAEHEAEIESLSAGMVAKATHCSACAHALDLPVVHFLCRHSFHQRCLNYGSSTGRVGGAGDPTPTDDEIRALAVREQLDRELGLGLTIIDPVGGGDISSNITNGNDNSNQPDDGDNDRRSIRRGVGPVVDQNLPPALAKLKSDPRYRHPRCPLCEKKNREIRAGLEDRRRLAQNGAAAFESEVRASKEPIGTVAKWVGKGVL